MKRRAPGKEIFTRVTENTPQLLFFEKSDRDETNEFFQGWIKTSEFRLPKSVSPPSLSPHY